MMHMTGEGFMAQMVLTGKIRPTHEMDEALPAILPL
jgi:hypothetical protein